jgi:hypothetical protein
MNSNPYSCYPYEMKKLGYKEYKGLLCGVPTSQGSRSEKLPILPIHSPWTFNFQNSENMSLLFNPPILWYFYGSLRQLANTVIYPLSHLWLPSLMH